jgi:hypothetical protein
MECRLLGVGGYLSMILVIAGFLIFALGWRRKKA